MDSEKNTLINSLKGNIDRLKSMYENEKLFKNNFKSENELLSNLIKEKDEKIKKLENDIINLKMAKALLGSGDDSQETKQKINKIVREIDKCIALLNK